MDVTVCISTYGDPEWVRLAERAIASARSQAPVIHRHGSTLANARNEALALVDTEWVVHLDADDELEPGYIEAMAAGSADLRAPAVRYVRGASSRLPYVPRVFGHEHDCDAACLPDGNWLVIGTAVRTELLRAAGGWREWDVYEDWDAFLRCWLAGGSVEAIPEAVYRAHVRPDSRNRAPSAELKNRTHLAIVEANREALQGLAA